MGNELGGGLEKRGVGFYCALSNRFPLSSVRDGNSHFNLDTVVFSMN